MGRIFDCSLTENFGNAGLSYIGGIAGINVNANNKNLWTYTTTQSYKSKDCQGTIKYCTTKAGKTISGKNCVGGITGYNLDNALLEDNISNISINAVGSMAGGVAEMQVLFTLQRAVSRQQMQYVYIAVMERISEDLSDRMKVQVLFVYHKVFQPLRKVQV